MRYSGVFMQTIFVLNSYVLTEVPWRLQPLLERIKYLFGFLKVQIKHIYREANGIADFLASFAVLTERNSDFSASGVLPLAGMLLLQKDQSLLPTARLKKFVEWFADLCGQKLCFSSFLLSGSLLLFQILFGMSKAVCDYGLLVYLRTGR
ncbi:unnamed protein product [Ilex paraguariensis]|uniref:RNase H type-1 domain-containing protein n=1 Tax=Ilex paraguariensis TaxID=185542 RepID=A0ABC8TMP8_9AQUA